MSALTTAIKVRLDEETSAELERQALEEERKPSALARQLIREGLAARLNGAGESRRV